MKASLRNDSTASLQSAWDVIDRAAARAPRTETEQATTIGLALSRRAQQLDWMIARQAFVQVGADDVTEEKSYRVLSYHSNGGGMVREMSAWYETADEAINAAMRGDDGR